MSPLEFQAAADEITVQMRQHLPGTWAVVTLPAGFTLYPVAESTVAGSVEAHTQVLRG